MDGVKSILASKTVWGGVAALLAGIMGILGYEVSIGDAEAITDHIDSIIAALGGLVAIWGRISATRAIG